MKLIYILIIPVIFLGSIEKGLVSQNTAMGAYDECKPLFGEMNSDNIADLYESEIQKSTVAGGFHRNSRSVKSIRDCYALGKSWFLNKKEGKDHRIHYLLGHFLYFGALIGGVKWKTNLEEMYKNVDDSFYFLKEASEGGNINAYKTLLTLYDEIINDQRMLRQLENMSTDEETLKKFQNRKQIQTIADVVDWLHLDSTRRKAGAQARLGWLYEMGFGVEQSRSTAMHWYKHAAQQGEGQARDAVERLSNSRN